MIRPEPAVAVRNQISKVQEGLIRVVRDAWQDQSLISLWQDFSHLKDLVSTPDVREHLDSEMLASIAYIATAINVTGDAMIEFEDCAKEQLALVRQESQSVLAQDFEAPPKHPTATAIEQDDLALPSDQINSSILREWFLAHLDDPFPTREEKERLSRASANAIASDPSSNEKPLDYSQVMLWYINSRRRSGWTGFFRRFAWEDKQRLKVLFKALREEGERGAVESDEEEGQVPAKGSLEDLLSRNREGHPVPPAKLKKEIHDCREAYDKIMDWVRQGTRQKVGDWLDEIVAAADRKRERRRLKRSKKLDAAASAARKAAVDAAAMGGFEKEDGKDRVQLKGPGQQQQHHQRQTSNLGLGLPSGRRVTRSMAAVQGEHDSTDPDDFFDQLVPSDSASRNVSGSSTLSSLEASGPPPLIGGSGNVGRLATYRNPSSSTDSSVYSNTGSFQGGGSHMSQSSLYLGGYLSQDTSDFQHHDAYNASPSIDNLHLPHHPSYLRLGGFGAATPSYESSLYDGAGPGHSFDFTVPAPGGITLYQHQPFPSLPSHSQPQGASMTFGLSNPGSTTGPSTPMPASMPSVLQLSSPDGGVSSGHNSIPLDPALGLSPIELQHHLSAQLLGPPAPYRTPPPPSTAPTFTSGPLHHVQRLSSASAVAQRSRAGLAKRLPVARRKTSGKVPATPKPGVLYSHNGVGAPLVVNGQQQQGGRSEKMGMLRQGLEDERGDAGF